MADARKYAEWLVANEGLKGTPEFQTVAAAYKRARSSSPLPAPANPDPMLNPTGSFTENLAAGAGKALTDLWRGAKDAYHDLGGGTPESRAALDAEIAESRRLDAPLMKTGGGLVGNVGANVAAMAPSLAVPGANTVAGAGVAGALMGALQPTLNDESRTKNIATAGVLGAAGQKAANVVGKAAQTRFANRQAAQAANQSRDKAIEEGIEAGYKFDPLHTNPEMSLPTRIARTFSGMRASEATLSQHNQGVTNRLARQAVGLADDADLESSLPLVVSDALDDYKALDGALREVGAVKANSDSLTKLRGLLKDYDELADEAPDLLGGNKSVEGIKALIDKGEFNGGTMIRLVRRLREKAKTDFKAIGDDAKKEAARIERAAADALEDMIEKAVADTADPQALARFKAARATLAKAHDIESALEAGNVNPAKLARMASKGAPLTDELRLIADMGKYFGRTNQVIKNARDPYSTLETGFTAGGAVMGEPGLMALGLMRPMVRRGLLSQAGQRATVMPQYGLRASDAVGGLLGGPAGQFALRSAGPASVGLLQQ